MTNFFLDELRKIYGDGRVIHDPQFIGECCYGSLGDLRVKARFTKDIVANQYPYLTVSILNPTKGEIDSVRMKIGDVISNPRILIRGQNLFHNLYAHGHGQNT